MAYTYNEDTSRGRVRLLVRDTTSVASPTQGTDYIFEDAEVDALLDLNGDDVWASAADACTALAASETLGALRLNLSGFTIDRTKVPEFWMKLAARYSDKAKAGDLVEYVDSFDHEISEFGEDDTEYVGSII